MTTESVITNELLSLPGQGSAAVLDAYADSVMNTFGTPKRVFVRGERCYVWDADGRRHLDLLSGLAVITGALFVTGLALAPTLIALFSLIEEAVPRERLNEAMGFVQTGLAAGIAPGAWLAGVVSDASGGLAAYWVCTVSAVLAALSGLWMRVPAATARPADTRLEPVLGD